jgi:hypothetical protein
LVSRLNPDHDRATEAATTFGSLPELNEHLLSHFEQLHAGRAGYPVYGLEHGLGKESIPRVYELVGAEVRRRGLSSEWRQWPLPLIVASTEIGYEYRGTGTDFWPRFEAAIGASLTHLEREQHSELFRRAHASVGLRKPADTSWSRLFRHIAWPIANAVAPREIHRPLARALNEVFSTSGSSAIDSELVAELRFAARYSSSTRFSEWLADDDLVAAVVMHLLEIPDPEKRLSGDTAERILRDLDSDPTARKAVKSAVKLHRERPAARARRRHIPVGITSFELRQCSSHDAELWLRLPALSSPVRRELKALLAKRGVTPRLWNLGPAVDLDMLLSGLPVPLAGIDVGSAFIEHRPFLEGGSESGNEASDTLIEDLAPAQTDPLVFRQRPFSEVFDQIATSRPVPRTVLRVLTSRRAPANEATIELGAVAGFRCFEVDASGPSGCEWLRALGVAADAAASLSLSGGIRISDGVKGAVYADALPLLVKPPSGVNWQGGDIRVDEGPVSQLRDGSVGLLRPSSGDHVLEANAQDFRSLLRFSVLKPETELEPLSLIVEPAEPTIDDLLRQQVVFRASGPAAAAELAYRLIVVNNGATIVTAGGTVDRLPFTISGSDPALSLLAEELRKSPPRRDDRLELLFELGPHWTQRWEIGWEPSLIEWEEAEGVWHASSGDEGLTIQVAEASEPLAPANLEPVHATTGRFQLLLPLQDDKPQLSDGLCVGPTSLRPRWTISIPDRVLRQVSSRDEGVGFGPALEAYLAWTLSGSEHLLASLNSKLVAARLEKVLVRQLCGQRWISTEERTPLLPGDPWAGLALVAIESELAAGGCLPAVPESSRQHFEQLLARHLKSAFPALWEGAGPSEPDAFAEAMDLAVIDAYEELGRRLEAGGQDGFEDVDTAGEPAAWIRAYEDTVARQCGRPLARLVLPESRASGLLSADYSKLLADEVIGLLNDLHADLNSRGTPRWLSAEDLALAFALWVNPARVLQSNDWKSRLERLLDDRPTSRAVRYAALRFRSSRQLSGPGLGA